MRHVYWIRHAQSTANAGHRTPSAAEILLTPLGHEQSVELARGFPARPGMIVTSPYVRTRLTALAMMARFEGVVHEEWPVHEFTFLTRGNAHNTTIQERRALAAPYWARMDPYLELGDGGESFVTFYTRMLACVRRAAMYRGTGPLVIFTHNRSLCLLTQFVLLPPADAAEAMSRLHAMVVVSRWEFPNTGILRMSIDEQDKVSLGLL